MKTTNITILLAAVLSLGLVTSNLQAADADWPQFRGPGARGVAQGSHLPDRWSDTENVSWKTDIPGRGWSSPIVCGNRVFLTTSVVPTPEEPTKPGLSMGSLGGETDQDRQWKVLCLDLDTGKILWDRTVHRGQPFKAVHAKNSFASETPVTDGNRIYAYFGNVGVFCLDFDGQEVWSQTIPPHPTRFNWGTAASPVLHKDRLYLVNDNEEDSYLQTLDKNTGKEIWRVSREEKSNWSTPYIWENELRTEIVTPGTMKTRSYDLDGKLLWSFQGMSGITIATPYADNGLLYVSSGFVMDKKKPLYAIRPGAKDDISLKEGETANEFIAWCNPTAAPYNPTTLLYENRLYALLDNGRFSAFDAHTGKPCYEQQKLPKQHFTSSPWAADGRVYCLNEEGVTFVVRAGDNFELLQTNKLADDDISLASPALTSDRILIRTISHLYCIRQAGN